MGRQPRTRTPQNPRPNKMKYSKEGREKMKTLPPIEKRNKKKPKRSGKKLKFQDKNKSNKRVHDETVGSDATHTDTKRIKLEESTEDTATRNPRENTANNDKKTPIKKEIKEENDDDNDDSSSSSDDEGDSSSSDNESDDSSSSSSSSDDEGDDGSNKDSSSNSNNNNDDRDSRHHHDRNNTYDEYYEYNYGNDNNNFNNFNNNNNNNKAGKKPAPVEYLPEPARNYFEELTSLLEHNANDVEQTQMLLDSAVTEMKSNNVESLCADRKTIPVIKKIAEIGSALQLHELARLFIPKIATLASHPTLSYAAQDVIAAVGRHVHGTEPKEDLAGDLKALAQGLMNLWSGDISPSLVFVLRALVRALGNVPQDLDLSRRDALSAPPHHSFPAELSQIVNKFVPAGVSADDLITKAVGLCSVFVPLVLACKQEAPLYTRLTERLISKKKHIAQLTSSKPGRFVFDAILFSCDDATFEKVVSTFSGTMQDLEWLQAGDNVLTMRSFLQHNRSPESLEKLLKSAVLPHMKWIIDNKSYPIFPAISAAFTASSNPKLADALWESVTDVMCVRAETEDPTLFNKMLCYKIENGKVSNAASNVLCEVWKFPSTFAHSIGPIVKHKSGLRIVSAIQQRPMIFENFISSPFANPRLKPKFIDQVRQNVQELALAKETSYLVEKCFAVGVSGCKRQIAQKLSQIHKKLVEVPHGRVLIVKFKLDKFMKQPKNWMDELNALGNDFTTVTPTEAQWRVYRWRKTKLNTKNTQKSRKAKRKLQMERARLKTAIANETPGQPMKRSRHKLLAGGKRMGKRKESRPRLPPKLPIPKEEKWKTWQGPHKADGKPQYFKGRMHYGRPEKEDVEFS